MSDAPAQQRPKMFVNVGAGPKGAAWLPPVFSTWREFRIDIDPATRPDLLADMTDLSAIEDASVDAVWSSHCLEHLYLHQASKAVAEAYRILDPGGFLCVIVPDIQVVADFIANDRLHDTIYKSPAGPVTPHDMLFGYGPYLAQGMLHMAHRSAFTPTMLLHKLQEAPFAEIVLRRRPNQELAAIACKRAPASDAARDTFLASLEL